VADFLQTYGSWFLFVLFIMLVLRMHGGGMGHGQHGEPAPPERPGARERARPEPRPAPAAGTPPASGVADAVTPRRQNPWFLLFWFAAWFGLMALLYRPTQQAERPLVDLSRVATEVRAGEVRKITVQGDTLQVTRTDGGEQHSHKEPLVPVTEALTTLGVEPEALATVAIEVKEPPANWGGLLVSVLPMALFVGFLWWMSRKGQQGMGQVMSFAKSRAKAVETRPAVTFADVAGIEEAKQELQEVVEFLREPTQFEALGARIPKGVLLVGPPGTGKTLLARAVAGEAGVAFFQLSGSEFVEMFVGVGASRVRDLFVQAKKAAPCIVFIDETRSAAIAGPGSAAATTSASRRSTRSWSRWTASSPTRASSSWPRPTGRTSSIRPCSGPGGSTGGSPSTCRTWPDASRSWESTVAASRSRRTSTPSRSHGRRRASRELTWRTS
jgi:hypothetical protein